MNRQEATGARREGSGQSTWTPYQTSRRTAERLHRLGRDPYASTHARYLVLLDDRAGEIVPLGRPLRGSRMFPSSVLRRDVKCIEQIGAFSAAHPNDEFLFWGVGITGSKVPVGHLSDGYNEFNRLINIHFSEMRKRNGFELLLLAIHPRYDPNTGKIDLHAHFICRIPSEQREACRRRLLTAFSKADVPERRIESLAAVATYMLWGIFRADELEALPDRVIDELWSLSQSKVRLVRTGGAFAQWRRTEKDPHAEAEARAHRLRVQENRKATADPRRSEMGGDQLLRKVMAKIDGKPTVALLYEERDSSAPAPVGQVGSDSSSATSVTTQEPTGRPSELASDARNEGGEADVRDGNGLADALSSMRVAFLRGATLIARLMGKAANVVTAMSRCWRRAASDPPCHISANVGMGTRSSPILDCGGREDDT